MFPRCALTTNNNSPDCVSVSMTLGLIVTLPVGEDESKAFIFNSGSMWLHVFRACLSPWQGICFSSCSLYLEVMLEATTVIVIVLLLYICIIWMTHCLFFKLVLKLNVSLPCLLASLVVNFGRHHLCLLGAYDFFVIITYLLYWDSSLRSFLPVDVQ